MVRSIGFKKALKKIYRELFEIKKDLDKLENKGYGILSDRDIRLRIHELFNTIIEDEDIQPASVDLHLDNVLKNLDGEYHNLKVAGYSLRPGEFILGSTSEYVTIPRDLVAQVDGKSSLGRLGIAIHITAGFIDPNFQGNVTLEIKNTSDKPFELKEGMPIAQIVFFTLTSPVERGYGDEGLDSHYQNSDGVISSKYKY
ncbi:dCTP deaminase [Methanobrevibacter sp.]|uniref:dCTP deaminase n=1 Tax=Methanobrevibacter sp. TaxID=66852 RepID=UPI00386749A6